MKKIFYLFLLFSSPLFGQHLGELPVNSDLGGYYHLSGNSNDATSNANNGTDVSMTYGLANGKFAQGALFNGTSSVISANGLISTMRYATTGTVSVWVNNSERVNARSDILEATNAATATSYCAIFFDWRTANKYIDVIFYISNAPVWEFHTALNSLIPIAGSWHNIILTQDGTAPLLYLDGNIIPITFITTTNKTKWFSQLFATGITGYFDLTSPAGNYYKGMLDEFIITKSKVWSAADVRKYYTQTKGRFQTSQ